MKLKRPKKRMRFRWHIPTDAEDHTQLISTLISAYIELKLDK